jgi:hypothetical protein
MFARPAGGTGVVPHVPQRNKQANDTASSRTYEASPLQFVFHLFHNGTTWSFHKCRAAHTFRHKQHENS